MSKYLKVNEETGEFEFVTTVNKKGETVPVLKHMPGNPKQYRFNGQTGQFNLNGEKPLLDANKKPIKSFSIQPIAYRFFEENLFARNKKDQWVEVFFIDDKDAVSSIIFSSSTANNLISLTRELFYEDCTICDIILTVTPEQKENKKTDGGKYYVGNMSFELADQEYAKELHLLDSILKVHRQDTLTDTAIYSLFGGAFFEEYVPQLIASTEQKALES